MNATKKKKAGGPKGVASSQLHASLALVGAAMMLAIAIVHLHLWASAGYRHIPTIGPLFLANFIIGLVVAFALIATLVPAMEKVPVLGQPWGQAALGIGGALFALGTLIGYIVTLTNGLFQFMEPGISYSGGVAIFAEVTSVAVLAVWAAMLLGWRTDATPLQSGGGQARA